MLSTEATSIIKDFGNHGTTVSRILKEVKKQGFVEINWNTPVSLDSQLSVILRKKRNLKVYILSVVKLYKVQAKK
ncbi:hypothetical protein SAMN05421787_113100 [Virgibacillus pantothenticus]|uniref:Uncharacterized protein n=1 Tax=Virgibacillus pantothenticus TaxID=1473 RepID=A0A0L0QSJ3_VIRPA|nr:hypothetical protein AFK71_05445 [Virgibacillus pantothenticus]SIT07023.1 hypothetical protein SAMN05421787_113100 [Virgibacillus pantothenticus]